MSLDLNRYLGLLDDDSGDPDSPYYSILNHSSPYIEESKTTDFLNFGETNAVNILHINCRSIKKNFDAIKDFVNLISGKLTALALTETWLSKYTEDVFTLPGYQFISNSRSDKGGGGVGLFICDSLNFVIRSDLCRMTAFIESIFIELPQVGLNNIVIGCVYRPPNSDVTLFNEEFGKILDNLTTGKEKLLFVAGDYNLDLLKFTNHQPTEVFLNNLISHSMFPSIRNPTRICETTATLLDNIFINGIQHKFSSAIVYNDISDHFPVVVHFETSLAKKVLPKCVHKRIYKPESIDAFNNQLASTRWDCVYNILHEENDPNRAYNVFFETYQNAFETNFPEQKIKRSKHMTPRHDWITKGLMKSCIRKSKLYKLYCQDRSDENKKIYVTYRNKLKMLLRKAEKRYYSSLFQASIGNVRETWKVIGNVLKNKPQHNPVDFFLINGNRVENKYEIVDQFNKYFASVGTNLASSIPSSLLTFSDYLKSPNTRTLSLYLTDPSEIINIVQSLSNKQSFGIDNIPTSIIKASIFYIAEPVSKLINSTFSSGRFPDALKTGKVCPIFKADEKYILSNYRPISILPGFSKFFEKALYNRLLSFLNSSHIIVNNQYGFRKKHSTFMAILDWYDNISKAIDNNEFALGIFIDLSKAFDTLNHNILCEKLYYYGVRGIPLQLFKNYLANRNQYVYFNGVSSPLRSVECGVPQGSILGPLLFILYVNDIVYSSSILKFFLFADDTNLLNSSKDLTKLISSTNEELSKVTEWFKANRLSLNVKKTHFMFFGNKQLPDDNSSHKLMLDGSYLEQVNSTKFLGLFIDEKLTWNQHISHISLKVSKGLGIISRVRRIFPQTVLLMLYYSLIYPYLSYCCIIWGNACVSTLNRVVILQKRAIRLVTNSPYRHTMTSHACLCALFQVIRFILSYSTLEDTPVLTSRAPGYEFTVTEVGGVGDDLILVQPYFTVCLPRVNQQRTGNFGANSFIPDFMNLDDLPFSRLRKIELY